MKQPFTELTIEKDKLEAKLQSQFEKKKKDYARAQLHAIPHDTDNPPSKKEKGFPSRSPIHITKKRWEACIRKELTFMLGMDNGYIEIDYTVRWKTTAKKSPYKYDNGKNWPDLITVWPVVDVHLKFRTVKVKAHTYAAKQGDTLGRIAERAYGHQFYWETIAMANPEFAKSTYKRMLFASFVKIPALEIPIKPYKKSGSISGLGSSQIWTMLPTLEANKSFKLRAKEGLKVFPQFIVKYKATASVKIAGRRTANMPAQFKLEEEKRELVAAFKHIDFGFNITEWSKSGLTCKTNLGSNSFKLKGKVNLKTEFEVKGETTFKFNNGKAEIAAIAVFELTGIILPNPKYNQPFWEDIGDFVAEHKNAIIVITAVASLAIITPVFAGALVRFVGPSALKLAY